jgi:glycosyltransferase 2 family protein
VSPTTRAPSTIPMPPGTGALPQIRDAVASLRRSQKLAQLILGSIATELLFAIALGMFARSMGYPISIAELLVINMSVSLFASFIPVPGGIGIVEGALVVGLTAVGLPEAAAFATALLYRIATFYLPPIWGWFALRWLRHNHYL